MAERGIVLSYETVRQWCLKCGQTYANELKRRRPLCGDKWYLDEVFLKINGKTHSLWRAVDQHGNVLDILVQSRRNKQAAKKFFRKLLKGLNHRAEHSHQSTRQRERTMRRFKSAGQAQRFLSAFGVILDHFRPKRHRLTAVDYRALMRDRFLIWNEVTRRKTAA